MTRPSLVVIVAGRPAPQGSKRHVGGGRLVESSAAVGPWRDAVRAATAATILATGWEVATGPVRLSAVYTMPRPPGHYRTGRNAHLLRDTAPAHPATRPDLDKLLRSTLDALVDAGALADDARVVDVSAVKAYPAGHLDALDTPGAVLVLRGCP
jgi:Holliday junction resolvase RusA-like endonuclease